MRKALAAIVARENLPGCCRDRPARSSVAQDFSNAISKLFIIAAYVFNEPPAVNPAYSLPNVRLPRSRGPSHGQCGAV